MKIANPNGIDLCGNNMQNVGGIENVPNGTLSNVYGEDSSGNLVKGTAPSNSTALRVAKLTLSSAELIALNSTPVDILPELDEGYSYHLYHLEVQPPESHNYSGSITIAANNIGFTDSNIQTSIRPTDQYYYGNGLPLNSSITLKGNYISDGGTSDPVDIYLTYAIIDLTTGEFVGNESGGSGASAFTDLSDTPESYTDQAGKMVVVNEGETALEFTDVPSGGGATAFTDLSDVPQSYTDQAGKMLVVNDDEDALEFTDVTETHTHTNKDILDGIIDTGDGDEFLADDGTYKAIGGLPTGTNGQTLRNNSGSWEANNIIENTATSNTYKAIEISDDSPSGAYKVRIRGHGSSVAGSVPYIGMEYGNNLTISASSLNLKGIRGTGSSYGLIGLGSYFGATLGQFINIQGSSTTAIMASPTFMLLGLTASKLVATNSSKELVSTDLIALSGGSVVKMLTADATRESNTTLAAVSDFTQALLASSKYRIVAKLTVHQAGGDADFKMQLTAPSGSSITGCYKIWSDGVNTQVTNNLYNDLTAVKNIEMDAYSDTAGYYYIEIEGIIETSTTAGNLTFSFAQLNSSAEITTLKKYSIIELTKI